MSKADLVALAAAARSSGSVRVQRIPTGKTALGLSPVHWDQIARGNGKVIDGKYVSQVVTPHQEPEVSAA